MRYDNIPNALGRLPIMITLKITFH